MKCYAIGKRSTRPTPLTTFPYHLEDLQTASDLVQRDLEVGELDRRAGAPGRARARIRASVSLGASGGITIGLGSRFGLGLAVGLGPRLGLGQMSGQALRCTRA